MTDCENNKRTTTTHGDEVERLSSEDLAALVVDALLRAGIVKEDDIERAVIIATEELDVRKTLGDY